MAYENIQLLLTRDLLAIVITGLTVRFYTFDYKAAKIIAFRFCVTGALTISKKIVSIIALNQAYPETCYITYKSSLLLATD